MANKLAKSTLRPGTENTPSPKARRAVYWLECRNNGQAALVQAHNTNTPASSEILLPLVSAFSCQRQPSIQFEHTLGREDDFTGNHVRIHDGFREQTFTLGGRTHSRELYDYLDGVSIDPNLHLRALEGWLKGYESLARNSASGASTYGSAGDQGVRLVFRASWEDISYLVEPVSFSWSRNAGSSKFSYEWQLTLRAYGKALSVDREFVDPAAAALGFQDRVFGAIQDLNRGRALVERKVVGPVDRAMRLAKSMVSVVDSIALYAEKYGDLVGAVQSMPGTLFYTARRAVRAVESAIDATPFVDMGEIWKDDDAEDHFSSVLRSLRDMQNAACISMMGTSDPKGIHKYETRIREIEKSEVPEDFFSGNINLGPLPNQRGDLGNPQTTPGGAYGSVVQGVGVITHVLLSGQTLEDLAMIYTGDPSNWPAIAALNGMKDPIFNGAGVPIVAGEELLVPSPTGQSMASFDKGNLLGTDFYIGPDGDLALESTDATDDVSYVSGPDCLSQDLSHKLVIKAGDSLVFPTLGLPNGPGDPFLAVTLATFTSAFRDLIVSDDRVSGIDGLTVVDGGDRLTVQCTVRVKVGGSLTVTSPPVLAMG